MDNTELSHEEHIEIEPLAPSSTEDDTLNNDENDDPVGGPTPFNHGSKKPRGTPFVNNGAKGSLAAGKQRGSDEIPFDEDEVFVLSFFEYYRKILFASLLQGLAGAVHLGTHFSYIFTASEAWVPVGDPRWPNCGPDRVPGGPQVTPGLSQGDPF